MPRSDAPNPGGPPGGQAHNALRRSCYPPPPAVSFATISPRAGSSSLFALHSRAGPLPAFFVLCPGPPTIYFLILQHKKNGHLADVANHVRNDNLGGAPLLRNPHSRFARSGRGPPGPKALRFAANMLAGSGLVVRTGPGPFVWPSLVVGMPPTHYPAGWAFTSSSPASGSFC